MLRKSALLLAVVGTLSACGHTPEERLVSGALIGGLVGATLGVASGSDHGHYQERRYHRRNDHRRGDWHGRSRRHRDYDDYY
jgi:hypothetical protein